ncbi:MAG: hypothetical protein M0Z94_08410 [Dehalococcoidales bacterium]|nr:hypothetical protein [Dehalococcoidales bacterium]
MVTASILLLLLLGLLPAPAGAEALDFDLADGSGHFYKQTNGQGGQGETGFAVVNADGIPFWDEYQRLGGPQTLGYPVSRRFVWDGFVVQAMQKVVFQWRPEVRAVYFVNIIDLMHDQGFDGWLQVYRQTPPPFDDAPDTGLPWDQVTRRHWAFLDTNPAIKARYWQDSDPLNHFGLPTSYADEGNCFVIRAQRAIFQYWKEDVPWARAGQVTVANGGALVVEVGLIPEVAAMPEPPTDMTNPDPVLNPLSHDWQSPGYVSAVGGQLYDPRGALFRSVGTNVPNLPYRDGLDQNLEWMRQHNMRWMRVFATGHSLGPDQAPADAADALAALSALLNQVEQFNSAHAPSESIYVLIALTDYYPPGVPGDRYAFDHPTFQQSPVLPAPWFRRGVRSFDFDQEHGFGRLYDLPNYEANYKPWVQQIVSRLSHSKALLGWQLGNELKPRGSPRNGITSAQAYDWYLDFTQDMVDTIRGEDRNHLIFMGAQYIAELVDWPYRVDGHPEPGPVSQYRDLVRRMLDACGEYCWNVWTVTAYDFNPYALDDITMFSRAGASVVATEYGFTRGTPDDMQERFGGDRATAVLDGLARPWQDIDGNTQPRLWSVPDLFASGQLAGAAPWASPAPGPGAEFDTDGSRGITGTPDEAALWSAWSQVAAYGNATTASTSTRQSGEAKRASTVARAGR